MNEKVAEWHKELEHLSTIAKSQPQATYSAVINSYIHKFTYYVQTVLNIAHLLKPIKDIITSNLLPQILGFEVSLLDHEIFALPTRLLGLGIPVMTTEADFEYNASRTLSTPLAALIVAQNTFALPHEETHINTTKNLKRERITRVDATSTSLNQSLTPERTRTLSNASAKGASNWLNVLLLVEEGYVLNKEELRDAMAMRYSKHILGLPSKCACGSNFDPVHALDCKNDGFIHSFIHSQFHQCMVLCRVMSYCIVWYCVTSCRIVWYCVMSYCIVWYCVVPCRIVLYGIASCHVVLYCMVLCRVMLYCMVLCHVVSCCILLYGIVSIVSYHVVSYCIV